MATELRIFAPASEDIFLRWNGLVRNHFLLSRLWFLVSLLVFMLSECILPKERALEGVYSVRVVVFFGRTFMYVVTMARLLTRSSLAWSRMKPHEAPGGFGMVSYCYWICYYLELLGLSTVVTDNWQHPRTLLEGLQGSSPGQVQEGSEMHSVAKVLAQCNGTGQFSLLNQLLVCQAFSCPEILNNQLQNQHSCIFLHCILMRFRSWSM